MYESEKQEKRDALKQALLDLVLGHESEADAGAVAYLLIEYLDEQERRIDALEESVARLKGWEG